MNTQLQGSRSYGQRASSLTDGSRWKKWKSVSRDDIKRAVCHPQHGHHPMPRYGIVLEDAVDVLHPLFHDVMPKN